MSSPQEVAVTRTRQRAVLGVICLSLATVVAAVASLNVAVPSIARDTHASLTQLSWIIDAYALVFAALLLLGGAIGDRFGRRRALLAGLTVFGGASAAAMATDSAGMLIAMRGLLGVGAALVMPATLSTITSTFPREERSRAVGTWAGVAGASAILGLLASGLLLEAWSWRSVFALNIALAAAAIIGTLLVIPESADPRAPKLDLVGALFTVAGLGILVYSIIEAPVVGWAHWHTIGGLGAGIAILVGFVYWELSRPNPLLDPRLFRNRVFAAGTLSLTLQFFAFFGFVFLVLQYLQLVLGNSPLVAALSLIPMALGMMPSARVIAPRLAARAGTRATCVAGLLLISTGLAVLAQLDSSSSYWLLLCGLLPLGAGMGLAMTPATTAITDALPPSQQGIGSAVNDLTRELGGALGIAVLGSIMQSAYRDQLDLSGLPGPVAAQARDSVAVALRLGSPAADRAREAFADGMSTALICAAVVVVCAAAAVAALLRHGRPAAVALTRQEATATPIESA
ncbi:MFS transporter [Streptomyces sp. 8K308]|uniref:MFS transporter n=1 Tax=Streptomyces sp. 8K308 TaxID=2530388 RepID=UPI00105258FC|nr:MFS transporter [Streptomyces sp. 8K308]TDC25874.1 MFS transporter [Streptomyces sp. 8K308]